MSSQQNLTLVVDAGPSVHVPVPDYLCLGCRIALPSWELLATCGIEIDGTVPANSCRDRKGVAVPAVRFEHHRKETLVVPCRWHCAMTAPEPSQPVKLPAACAGWGDAVTTSIRASPVMSSRSCRYRHRPTDFAPLSVHIVFLISSKTVSPTSVSVRPLVEPTAASGCLVPIDNLSDHQRPLRGSRQR